MNSKMGMASQDDDRSRRRTLLLGSIMAGIVGIADASKAQTRRLDADGPIPAQAPAKEGLAQLKDTKLWYSDTGGNNPAVVFLHPTSGSGLIWSYQQPVFVAAGYRVVTYSRRGYYNSDPVPTGNPGTAAQDLHGLISFLGLTKFHMIASAGGVGVAIDYALSHPERLSSMVLANGTGISQGAGGVQDADYAAALTRVRVKGFDDMPVEFREISPSYRATNPDGVRRWLELHHKAFNGNRAGQKPANEASWTGLAKIKIPTLLVTGDADLILPPPLLRLFAKSISDSETLVVTEAGHSVYWEQPAVFNRAVLDFMARHA